MESVAPTKKRQRLSRERVLDAAIALARTDGIAGVSMPSVSRSLGTTPMSLYRYVENKEALVLGMLARVTEAVVIPDRRNDPAHEVVAVFLAIHEMMRADPWIVPHFLDGYRGGEPVRVLTARSLTAFAGLGLERRDAWHAHQALLRYTYGDVLATTPSPRDGLSYHVEDSTLTEVDETIRGFQEAAANDEPGERYRETLQRYLRSVLDEVGRD